MHKSILLGAACAIFASCASTPAAKPQVQPAPVAATIQKTATPAAEMVDHAGDSTTTAIEVPADAPDGGVEYENRWIWGRIGRFRRDGGGTGTMSGRRYDVVEVETPKGDHYKFYFDITENWKNWKPAQP